MSSKIRLAVQIGGICALLAVGLLAFSLRGKAQPAPVSPFGMNAHLSQRFDANTKNMESAADKLEKAGVSWSREEFLWYDIDPDPGGTLTDPVWQKQTPRRFDYITAMELLKEKNINVLGLLTYGPKSNVSTGEVYQAPDPNKKCPVTVPNAAPINDWLPEWEEYVRAVVEKFGDQIDVWEIQNEENER